MVIGIGPVSLFSLEWRNAGCSSFVSRLADAFRSGGKENFRLRQMRTRQKRQGRMPTAAKTQVKVSPVRSPQATREAALQARIAELEDELQTRDDFLAIAAHELRNPMTPISARVELLLARARHMPELVSNGIVQGLERLEGLVDAYLRRTTILLEVSRIHSSNLRLRPIEVDLSALVRQVAKGMSPAAERAGCRVGLTVQEGVTGRFDATALEQILENLLSNAIRYAPGQPIEVALTSDIDSARLSVRDEGIGISDRDQAQIFERFHTLGRKGENGGFGVGLWITRQLVRAMRGEIAVSSNAGVGSTFTVTLPLLSRDEDDGH
jgi:two-component system OmpR family sensor kinase